MIIVLEISMCSLIQKHVFIYFRNNQKLLIQFNQIDVIVGKSLVKHGYTQNISSLTSLVKHISLIISNWKTTSNCCLPGFLPEALINHASNMICITLNNCTIFWKQQELLLGLDNLQKLVSVGAIRRFIFSFFFLEIKTLVEIEWSCCYGNGSL